MIWIVGVGGIGAAIGVRLAQHHKVCFVDSWSEHVQAMAERGLTVNYPEGPITAHAPAVELGGVTQLETPETVLLAVKSKDTASTTRQLLPHLGSATIIVSLQNGLNEETIADIVGTHRTIGAVVRFDGALAGPAEGRQFKSSGSLTIGELDGRSSERLRHLADVLACSVDTEVTNGIWAQLWAKLIRNCTLNGVAAITGFGLGRLGTSPTARRACLLAALEATRVARAAGVPVADDVLYGLNADQVLQNPRAQQVDLEQRFEEQYAPFPEVRPSMLQDIDKGRATEVDHLNGIIARKGREHGVPTPMNNRIIELVHRVEADPASQGVHLLALET